MQNINMQAYFNQQVSLFTMVEDFLSAWDWDKNKTCQLPILLKHLQEQNNWLKKEQNAKDPLIRDYLRSHIYYDISRGAFGGIILRAVKQKRDAEIETKKAAIEAAKKEINASFEAKINADTFLGEANSFLNEDENYLPDEEIC